MPTKNRPNLGNFKRKLKGKRVQIPPELRARILDSVIKGESHWTLDPDDLALPVPDKGSRRIVFESVFGPVSSRSEVYPTCHDPECVNPYHCQVENVKAHLMKLEGKLPRLVFSTGKQVMPIDEFEKSLLMAPNRMRLCERTKALIAREAEALKASQEPANRWGGAVEDPLIG